MLSRSSSILALQRFGPDQPADPFDLSDDDAYRRWREAKLSGYPDFVEDLVVEIGDLGNPTSAEIARIQSNCQRANMAIYATATTQDDPGHVRQRLQSFAAAFGLRDLETHRSAGEDGVVALEVDQRGARKGYIPYTNRPLNWHTDGYYNAPEARVRGFLLHCVRSAAEGGENGLLDPEIAYIRLRDEDPTYISALMHPDAMGIPANVEANGDQRPASTGPVFFMDPETGVLQMRYTARRRNITWRDDAATSAATAALARLLNGNEPLAFTHKLAPGQGIICNNVLHNRTGFTADPAGPQGRLHLRARYADRVGGT